MLPEQAEGGEGDLRAAEDDTQLGACYRQGIDQFQGFTAIPEVDREGDDIGAAC